MHARCTRRPIVLALAFAIGCDEPLKHGEVLDGRIFSVRGTISPMPSNAALALGILWIDPAQVGEANAVSGSELVQASIDSNGGYAMHFYGPPPQAAVRWLRAAEDSDAVVGFAFGEFVLYEDRDQDGTFRVGSLAEGSPMVSSDVYRGLSSSRVLVYVAKPLSLSRSVMWGLGSLLETQGYQVGSGACRTSGYVWLNASSPEDVALESFDAASAFENPRDCMRSHPVEADP
jgi:hypothetical protein